MRNESPRGAGGYQGEGVINILINQYPKMEISGASRREVRPEDAEGRDLHLRAISIPISFNISEISIHGAGEEERVSAEGVDGYRGVTLFFLI